MMSLLSTLLAYIQLLEMTKNYLKLNLTIGLEKEEELLFYSNNYWCTNTHQIWGVRL